MNLKDLVSAYFLLALVCHLCVKTFERKKKRKKLSFRLYKISSFHTYMLSTNSSPGNFQKSRVKLRKDILIWAMFQKKYQILLQKNITKKPDT